VASWGGVAEPEEGFTSFRSMPEPPAELLPEIGPEAEGALELGNGVPEALASLEGELVLISNPHDEQKRESF